MFDQLRFDYLSCTGHPHLHTPNIDWLASRGVRFSRCYVQAPVCGASRMSFYTGRYVQSHGAAWNNFPLKAGEHTLSDHLRDVGMSSWLVGKTHMAADTAGMKRLGIDANSAIGARVSECGFDVFVREDGLQAVGPDGHYDTKPSAYNEYLKERQYPGDNPWHDYANSGVEDDLTIASGWLLKHSSKPANIREQDSETPWLTREAIRFIDKMQGSNEPWHCHLSYIKPHWPYIVPEPYHNMYSAEHVMPAVRDEQERIDAHPVYEAYFNNVIGKAISSDGVREVVVPAYMGLIKQCDDQLGVLFDHLKKTGNMQDTMIVITSDHGDYLGDHWLGEKDLFHECSVKVPLIIYDPSSAANATRGTVCDELVESIDLAATFIEVAGGEVPGHIIEGRSLLPFIHDKPVDEWRDYAISEFDYSATMVADKLNIEPRDARLFMVADKRWKFMHSEGGFRPMLFDMKADPDELVDLGDSARHNDIIEIMYERLGEWGRRLSQRTTKSESDIDGSEISDELLEPIRGTAVANFVESGNAQESE